MAARLTTARDHFEKDLSVAIDLLNRQVENADRKPKIENQISKCADIFSSVASKNADLIISAPDDSAIHAAWLEKVKAKYDEVLARARKYLDELPASNTKGAGSEKTAKSKSTSKSQMSHRIEIDIIEEDNKLADELEEIQRKKLEQQQAQQQLELIEQQLKAKHARVQRLNDVRLAAAASENGSQKDIRSVPGTVSVHSQAKVEDWLNVSPNGTADPAITPNNFPLVNTLTAPPFTPPQPQQTSLTPTDTKLRSVPKWKLQEFDGNPLKWPQWRGLFLGTVGTASITDDERLLHLQTLCIGKAQSAIQHCSYGGRSYREAWSILEKKFGRPHVIVNAHLEEINKFPPLKMHNSENLIDFSLVVSGFVNVLAMLAYDADLRSASNLAICLNKLPPNLREKWAGHVVHRTDRPDLSSFSTWLERESDKHEYMRSTTPSVSQKAKAPVVVKKTLLGHTVTASNSPKAKCPHCNDAHPLYRCDLFKKLSPTDRAKVAMEKKYCFSCLNGEHQFRKCPRSRVCGIDGCKDSHNVLLHGADRVFPKRAPETVPADTKAPKSSAAACSAVLETDTSLAVNAHSKGLLQVVEIFLHSFSGSASAMCLCDPGSTDSWIDTSLASSLGLSGPVHKIPVTGFNTSTTVDSEYVSCALSSAQDNKSFRYRVSLFTKADLSLGNEVVNVRALKSKYWNLEPLPDSPIDYSKIKVILGMDNFDLIYPLACQFFGKKKKNLPCAVQLPLGWALSGSVPAQMARKSSTCGFANNEPELFHQVRSWYEIESYGTKINVDPRAADDQRASKILADTTSHDGVRYNVGMLWASDDVALPNNYYAALAQFKSLESRLEKSPDLREKYAKSINDDIEKGYVVKLTPAELDASTSTLQWYLPHHPVVNPNKPGKVRRVLNGASKFRGKSLNSALLTGPDLLRSLVGILLRFRESPVAISADIEGMFLQVGVLKSDQPVLRFLWREESTARVETLQYTRHIFGAKDSPTCANYALERTATDNENEFPHAAAEVLRNFYMDDFMKSIRSKAEAITLGSDLIRLLALGGFKLCKWISNDATIAETLNALCETAPSQSANAPVVIADQHEAHVLGLKWDFSRDVLVVSRGITKEMTSNVVTQRVVLSFVSSVFDPVGLVAPVTITARLLLKRIWKTYGQQWDTPLDDEITREFIRWMSELKLLQDIEIPRCYFAHESSDELELHIFGDASEEAFCAVAFLRACHDGNKYSVSFVLGKARVAPMKCVTLPKLELQAALLAARLKKSIQEELSLPVKRYYLWSDSTTVLQWLAGAHKKHEIFVANRISEILEYSSFCEWRHIPGTINPADCATRGLTASELNNSTWHSGPAFLRGDAPWPENPVMPVETTITLVSTHCTPLKLDWTKHSSFRRYQRVMVYILRLLPRSRRLPFDNSITADELCNAERKLFYLSQCESFTNERDRLSHTKSVKSKSSLAPLSPFIGYDNLLRSKGRLARLTSVPFETRHPILLDGRHPIVVLFLRMLHSIHMHAGVEHLRAIVRERLWVTRLRSVLKTIKTGCVSCRRFSPSPLQPEMADLPSERLDARNFPFASCGVDYFGPISVTVKRSSEKRWAFLFTCLTTRAVHIEIVHSMSTDACLMGIQRFVARRGQPRTIVSDNGTNFVGADHELQKLVRSWNVSQITEELATKGITWKFNPPASPHHGGAWERLVRSCKRSLYAVLGSRAMCDEVLVTAMALVEQSLNSRPLVPVSSDINDLEALTPNHFLLGRPSVIPPLCLTDTSDVSHRKAYVKAEAYANWIWSRWLKEYAPSLNVRHKWAAGDRSLACGDLVWIVDPATARGHYPMARIESLTFGADGTARSAKLLTSGRSYTRPLTKLAPVFPSGPEDVANKNNVQV